MEQDLDTINVLAQKNQRKALEGHRWKDLYTGTAWGGKYIDIILLKWWVDMALWWCEYCWSGNGRNDIDDNCEAEQRFSVQSAICTEYRNSISALEKLKMKLMGFSPIPLETVADIKQVMSLLWSTGENAMLEVVFV
jgi:hypothetical protein